MIPGLQAAFERRFPSGPTVAVDALHVSRQAGVTVLFGASGSGKTTVLRCLAGLERPDAGRISFAGETWFEGSSALHLAPRLRRVGFVPQDYALFPHLSVEHNIAYGLHSLALAVAERRTRVAEAVTWLGLEGLERRLPRELSGGQQQRVALARAVVWRPRLLLLDEPLSALDAPTRQRLRGELRALLLRFEIPTLLVTHDRQEAVALGDDIVVLSEGRIVQQGSLRDVFRRPSSPAVADLLAVETVQAGRVLDQADGLTLVQAGDARLTALARGLPVGTVDVLVCVRAEDVILTLDSAGASSARNRLVATVRGIQRDGPLVRIELDAGFPLTALLTQEGCDSVGLEPGREVVALIKAPDIHLIPHVA